MGELVVSNVGTEELACIGLGSCIGLALLDRNSGVAGLAHVMLPESPSNGKPFAAAKFGDTALAALVDAVISAGARKLRLEAAIVGGAQMFAFGAGNGKDIGRRNEAAVRATLDAARIPLRAAATGGSSGRSMRVHVGTGYVMYRESAGQPVDLVGSAPVLATA